MIHGLKPLCQHSLRRRGGSYRPGAFLSISHDKSLAFSELKYSHPHEEEEDERKREYRMNLSIQGVLGVFTKPELGPRTGSRSIRADSGAWRTDAVTDFVALPERTGSPLDSFASFMKLLYRSPHISLNLTLSTTQTEDDKKKKKKGEKKTKSVSRGHV